ncbi:MAG: hypothetical protein V3U31_05195, partial [Dehalococcoidia bacterium]
DFEALEFMKDAGMEVYFISPEEATAVWEKPVSQVIEQFKTELGPVGERALGIIQRATPE